MAKKEFIKPVFGTWTSVKEQKPRKNTSVIVCIYTDNEFHEPFSCQFDGNKFFSEDDGSLIEKTWSNTVSHWMPLPHKPTK